MKALFLALLAANVVFFVYTYIAAAPDDPAAQIQRLQLHPEKIRLIGNGETVQREPAREPAAAAAASCLEWGPFAGPAIVRAEAAIARLKLPAETIQRAVVDSGGYWVYVPPLKSKAATDAEVEDLKARRVTDFFVVQDPPQLRNAISLGIFKTEESANSLLNELRDKGVHDAVVERREDFLKQVAFYMRQPSIAMVARLAELQREFPGSEVKAGPCPGGS